MIKVERIRKDLETLAQFTATPGAGVTRMAFSPEERQAREYLQREMEAIGLEVYTDAVGNLFGRRAGKDPEAPVVMIGSHIDSVKNGGPFDGAAGVVAALEIARALQDMGKETVHPIEVVVMTEEEGGRFGSGLFGSRAMVDGISQEELTGTFDEERISKAEAMKAFGLDPDKVREAVRKPGSVKAFLELHIEQGPVLESTGTKIGIVESIVGIRTFFVTIYGSADHAGTTPMNMRRDALVAASRVITAIDGIAREAGENTVGTVGSIQVKPGSNNVVPAEVRFSIDLRDGDNEVIERATAKIKQVLAEVCEAANLTYTWEEALSVPPVATEAKIIDIVAEAAQRKNISFRMMPSGAGHDAMVMARLAPVGLLFVPSRDGKSHCPEEWTDYEDIALGAELYLDAVLALAQ
ncbi:MAG: Zn-dependent hydrolase [bacterium]|nr:Zn-dependent hydrolase [Bacillota bacterium]HHW55761.1 Zn-dependent hydrolase [Bacillota bacterium]